MPWFTIETRGDARELYGVEADTEADARAKFDNGEITQADLIEVSSVEIVDVTQDMD